MAVDDANLKTELEGKLHKAVAGKDLVLYIYDATGAQLLAIAGQQGLTINRDKDLIEVTSKDSDGWKENITGFREWSIDNDGIYVPGDESHQILIKSFNSGDPLLIKVTNIKTQKDMFGGMCVLSSYPIEAPYDDATTYSLSLSGTGELKDLTE